MASFNSRVGLTCIALFCSVVEVFTEQTLPGFGPMAPHRPWINWEGLRLGLVCNPFEKVDGRVQGFIDFIIKDGVIAGCRLWESTDAMNYDMALRSIVVPVDDAVTALMEERESVFKKFDMEHGISVDAESLHGSLVTVTGTLERMGHHEIGIFRNIESIYFNSLMNLRFEQRRKAAREIAAESEAAEEDAQEEDADEIPESRLELHMPALDRIEFPEHSPFTEGSSTEKAYRDGFLVGWQIIQNSGEGAFFHKLAGYDGVLPPNLRETHCKCHPRERGTL